MDLGAESTSHFVTPPTTDACLRQTRYSCLDPTVPTLSSHISYIIFSFCVLSVNHSLCFIRVNYPSILPTEPPCHLQKTSFPRLGKARPLSPPPRSERSSVPAIYAAERKVRGHSCTRLISKYINIDHVPLPVRCRCPDSPTPVSADRNWLSHPR